MVGRAATYTTTDSEHLKCEGRHADGMPSVSKLAGRSPVIRPATALSLTL